MLPFPANRSEHLACLPIALGIPVRRGLWEPASFALRKDGLLFFSISVVLGGGCSVVVTSLSAFDIPMGSLLFGSAQVFWIRNEMNAAGVGICTRVLAFTLSTVQIKVAVMMEWMSCSVKI